MDREYALQNHSLDAANVYMSKIPRNYRTSLQRPVCRGMGGPGNLNGSRPTVSRGAIRGGSGRVV